MYGDRALYEVPLEELIHEVVFLMLLNQLPWLTYDTIKESVEAAVRIHPSITPIELFHQYGYKTYFTPTSSVQAFQDHRLFQKALVILLDLTKIRNNLP